MSINTSCRRLWIPVRAIALLAIVSTAAASAASAATLDRIRETGHIKFGYFADASPFTSQNGNAVEGYAATLCQSVADKLKSEMALSSLTIDWVVVTPAAALDAVSGGQIDALCTPTAVTIDRRKRVSYSIPVFPGGARAVVRNDAPTALKAALAEGTPPKPVWRGAPAGKTVQKTRVGFVRGSATQDWVISRADTLQIAAQLVPVPDYKSGLQQLRDRQVDVFFGELAATQSAMGSADAADFSIIDRMYTREPYGIALARGDEDLRLAVDRALSALYSGGEIDGIFQKSFGPPSAAVKSFFQWNAQPL
jgi:ABC-type amino acid transport substrate-binding protein